MHVCGSLKEKFWRLLLIPRLDILYGDDVLCDRIDGKAGDRFDAGFLTDIFPVTDHGVCADMELVGDLLV